MNRFASVNVDIDGLPLYYRIHGLEESGKIPSVYETGVRRFLDLFAKLDIKATFFVIAQDALIQENRAILEEAIAQGHEIASHSFSHPYDLIRLPEKEMEAELAQAEEILQDIRGGKPVCGFRAPGYNISPPLIEMLAKRGYAYDSSLFPCPPYYLAKAGYIGLYKLLNRPSASILGNPSQVFGSRHPHRWSDHPNLLEFPMTVTPWIRFPIIGTSLISMGATGWKLTKGMLSHTPFVNLEFHAIDMTDHVDDGIDDALLSQPDQKVSLIEKTHLFTQCLSDLNQNREFRTLEDLATHPELILS